jgi:hypothetical protein
LYLTVISPQKGYKNTSLASIPAGLIFSSENNIKSFINKRSSNRFNRSSAEFFDKTLLEFLSSLTGARSLVQFYPFLASGNITQSRLAFYKTWVPRLNFYQNRLGHRFFLEETIQIMHLSLALHDANLFSSWLASLIKRISF